MNCGLIALKFDTVWPFSTSHLNLEMNLFWRCYLNYFEYLSKGFVITLNHAKQQEKYIHKKLFNSKKRYGFKIEKKNRIIV